MYQVLGNIVNMAMLNMRNMAEMMNRLLRQYFGAMSVAMKLAQNAPTIQAMGTISIARVGAVSK